MRMAVMAVGQMCVRVPLFRMNMAVAVRLAGRILWAVRVTVMLVVHMPMLVLDRLMVVLVGMALGQMQPHTRGHESPRQRKLSR